MKCGTQLIVLHQTMGASCSHAFVLSCFRATVPHMQRWPKKQSCSLVVYQLLWLLLLLFAFVFVFCASPSAIIRITLRQRVEWHEFRFGIIQAFAARSFGGMLMSAYEPKCRQCTWICLCLGAGEQIMRNASSQKLFNFIMVFQTKVY